MRMCELWESVMESKCNSQAETFISGAVLWMRPFTHFPTAPKDSRIYGWITTIRSHGKCHLLCAEHLVSVSSERDLGRSERQRIRNENLEVLFHGKGSSSFRPNSAFLVHSSLGKVWVSLLRLPCVADQSFAPKNVLKKWNTILKWTKESSSCDTRNVARGANCEIRNERIYHIDRRHCGLSLQVLNSQCVVSNGTVKIWRKKMGCGFEAHTSVLTRGRLHLCCVFEWGAAHRRLCVWYVK